MAEYHSIPSEVDDYLKAIEVADPVAHEEASIRRAVLTQAEGLAATILNSSPRPPSGDVWRALQQLGRVAAERGFALPQRAQAALRRTPAEDV